MRFFSPRLQRPGSALAALVVLFIVLPLVSRYALGWSHPFGYLSDLAIGSLLLWLAQRRGLLLGDGVFDTALALGGRVVAATTPEDLVRLGTHTGKVLGPVLART